MRSIFVFIYITQSMKIFSMIVRLAKSDFASIAFA